jgi:hypothetical protein
MYGYPQLLRMYMALLQRHTHLYPNPHKQALLVSCLQVRWGCRTMAPQALCLCWPRRWSGAVLQRHCHCC